MGLSIPYDQLWWHWVHGPSRLCRELIRAIPGRGCIFLHHSAPLPWAETFRTLVLEEAESRAGSLRVIQPVDCSGQTLSESDFLARFAPACAQGFLSTTALPAYLDKRGALDGQIVWLYGLEEGDQAAWAARLGEFAALPAAGRCAVVLELTGKRIQRKKVLTLSADELLRPFDVTQFCTMAVGEGGESSGLMDYLTCLCTELTGVNPERLPPLLRVRSALLEDPVGTVADLFGLSEGEAVRHVRRAQYKLLLPLLEDLRVSLLTELSEVCAPILPFEDEFGNQCHTACDMELRHLIHFHNRGKITIPPELWEEVRLAYDARNLLMHQMKPLDFARLRELLSAAARRQP